MVEHKKFWDAHLKNLKFILKIYIENLFQEGMSWEKHGDWHLDHRTPVSWAKSESEVYELNKYENFKPMWAFENMSKGNKYTD